MTLSYQDFWPQSAPVRRARGGVAWEPLAGVLERVNQWLESTGQRALNVETLVLPVAKREAVKPADGGTLTRWDEDYTWVQVVRVWYDTTPVVAAPPVLMAPASGMTPPTEPGVTPPADTAPGYTNS